jgi:hypothetical protein
METPLRKLIAAVRGEKVFGSPLDGIIRQISDELTAHHFLEACSHCDLDDPDWPAQLARELNRRSVIAQQEKEAEADDEPWNEVTEAEDAGEYLVYLKLNFRTEEASFYQFELFPRMNKAYIKDYEKLKVGNSHYLRVVLASKRDLELFVRSLKNNHHLKSVEQIDEEDFKMVETA